MTQLLDVPGVDEEVAVDVLQSVGARSDDFRDRVRPFP